MAKEREECAALEGSGNRAERNSQEAQGLQGQQEIIEVDSDDEAVLVEDDDSENTQDVIPVIETGRVTGNVDEEVQITGAQVVQESAGINGRRHADTDILSSERRRNLRRRLNDDDIEIIDERPAATPISSTFFGSVEGLDEYRRSLMNRIQRSTIGVPVGSFPGGTQLSSLISDLERVEETRQRRTDELRGYGPNIRRALRPRTRRNIGSTVYPHLQRLEVPDQLLEEFIGNWSGLDEDMSNSMEQSILSRIEQDNETAINKKQRLEILFNRKALNSKKDIVKNELEGYTNNLSPPLKVVCELCGVILGQGIPEDFKPDLRYDKEFLKYSRQYKVTAPWFCIKECSPIDIEFSKRVFAAKCGHLYCGRCVRNIVNRPPGKKKSKVATIDNSLIRCPKKCVAVSCEVQFKGKRYFRELYF